ncbi:MAG: M23 family metallopeptidase [Bdellovibrio sp.]|nr:M23 family metallopeptidase [Bdellovibrio sp.]
MTAKEWCVPPSFFLGVLVAVQISLLSSCSYASIQNPAEKTAELKPPPLYVKAELSPREVVPGKVTLITVALIEDPMQREVNGEFQGIEVPFFPMPEQGSGVYGALLGIPYEQKQGLARVRVRVADGKKSPVEFDLPVQISEGQYPSEKLKVDSSRVSPTKKKVLARIKREQLEVAELYKRVTRRRYWKGPFSLPIQSAVTSSFGTRRVFNGSLKNYHPGLDLKAAMKTPVRAAAGGEVVLAKDLFYTGKTVMVDHGYGIITLYAHLSRLKVKKGQTIQSRDLVGLSGNTGRVNGPHLHWQAVVHKVKVDPIGLTEVLQ